MITGHGQTFNYVKDLIANKIIITYSRGSMEVIAKLKYLKLTEI